MKQIIKTIKYINITKITIYMYIYKYTDRDNIKRLRCYDINCKGTAKLTHTGKIEIVNECDILCENHLRKKEIIWHKIKLNLFSSEEIKQ